MSSFRTHLSFFVFCFITLLFSFLRLYKLDSSLEFFNDLGRDFLVMYDWQSTGKPPLLGPQTSVLAFNQSAWYFYLLYPFYILFNQSLFSTTYAMVFYALTCFSLTFIVIRKYARELTTPFLSFFFLSAIHPVLITQQRFVWNPSFVLPTLTIALFGVLVLIRQWKSWLVWLIAACISFAISMSYSTVPALIGFFLAFLVLWKKRALLFVAAFAITLFFWNIPTVIFELRHNFSLTNIALSRGQMPQTRADFPSKLRAYGVYLFSADTAQTASKIMGMLILVLLLTRVTKPFPRSKDFNVVILIFLGTFFTTLISPFDIQPHYIFPILTLLFGCIVFLPRPIPGFLVLSAALYWLHPQQVLGYTKPALRTVKQIEQCAQKVCAQEKQPMFVSEQAGFHVFHTGPEYRYVFKKHGCLVQSLETSPDSASHMAVVVDNSTYEHGKTAYNELTIFGPSDVQREYTCDGNIQVIMVQKKK